MTILLRGFTDWDAACPDMQWPSMTVNSNGLYVDWGKQYCYIRPRLLRACSSLTLMPKLVSLSSRKLYSRKGRAQRKLLA